MGIEKEFRGHTGMLCALLLAALPLRAFALDPSQESISNLALFNRCYSHLTGKSPSRAHPLRGPVVAGTKSPIDACMEVLENGTLLNTSNGATDGSLKYAGDSTRQAEGLLVLRNLNDFHRSWFPSDDIASAVPEGSEFYWKTPRLHDEGEAALHVTRALLAESATYSDVILSTTSMEGLRTSGPWKDTADAKRLNTYDPTQDSDGQGRGHGILDAWLVEKGDLRGIRKMSLNTDKWGKSIQSNARYYFQATGYGPMPPANFYNRPLGGGIIGLQSYLVLNIGRPDILPMDGGLRMNRRWSRAVMTDLMCRDLPALRASDAVPYVQPTPAANTPTFRTSRNCMACHTTIDPLAAVIRNLSFAPAPERWGTAAAAISSMHVAVWPPTLPREAGQIDADDSYFKRPTWGRLQFRSYDGTLVRKEVANLQKLGEAMADTNDLYVCAASRYYQFFTGVQVSLQDVGDPASVELSKSDLAYRDEVIKLGIEFKSHKSLRTLIRKIMELPTYRSKSMRSYGEVGEASE